MLDKGNSAVWILSGLGLLFSGNRLAIDGTLESCLRVMQATMFVLLLLIAAWVDYRKRIIPDTLNIGIALSALLCFSPENLLGVFVAVPFLIAAMKGGMGGGDVKLTGACGLVLGVCPTLFGCVAGLALMLCFCACCKRIGQPRKAYPMAPFLAVGFIIVYFAA